MDFLRLPFFDSLRDAQTVLLAGMGGGYDIYSGVPLYCGLCAAGKTVHLANLSFTSLGNVQGIPSRRSTTESTRDSSPFESSSLRVHLLPPSCLRAFVVKFPLLGVLVPWR